jgi:cell division septal protein FtsQ
MSRRASKRGAPSRAEISAPSDRRFRRGDGKPMRRRLVPIVRRLVRYGAPVAVVVSVLLVVAATLLNAAALSVRHFDIRGNTRLTDDDLQAMLAGVRGRNILRADFEDVRSRVRESPWVADVRLARVLPSTIRIDIVERTPMAVARHRQQLYLVDEHGVIIDEFGPRYAEFDLPIVDGLLTSPARGVPAVDPARVRLTGRFLTSLGPHPDLRRRISQVDVSNARDLAALLEDDPAWLHLGDEAFAERLQAYLDLADTLHERLPGLDYVDLRFGERIFARARETTAEFDRQ